VEEIGPQAAQRLLARDDHCTDLHTVARYADMMLNGQWRPPWRPTMMRPCSGIQISPAGRVLDGHHRLAAVVASGVPQPFLIVRPRS